MDCGWGYMAMRVTGSRVTCGRSRGRHVLKRLGLGSTAAGAIAVLLVLLCHLPPSLKSMPKSKPN